MKRLLPLLLLLLIVRPASASVIPPEGVDKGFFAYTGIAGKRAVVLCESLTVCDAPNGQATDSLLYGESLIATLQHDGWVFGYYCDGTKTGWVRASYLLVDPAYHVADAQTPVYAYTDASAPRVALLSAGEQLPIMGDVGDWRIVSLRGAAGCIRKSAADKEQCIVFSDPLLPDRHELSQAEAYELAKTYLMENALADAQSLASLPHDFGYHGSTQIGWLIRWRDSSGRILWQVSLEKQTGAVLEAIDTVSAFK